jgi:hypothetical protein
MPIYPNTQLVFTDTNGNTGTTILPNSIITPSINASSLLTLNGRGATGQLLSTTGSELQWISSNSITNPITNNINTTSITNTNTITTTNLNTSSMSINNPITNTISFNNPPISNSPTISSHLATKEYVDSVLPGLYNLYLNKSQPSSISNYLTLSTSMTGTTGQTTTTSTGAAGSNTLVNSFITEPLNVNQIPPCLLCLNIWGLISVITDPVSYYAVYQLYRDGTIIELGTSSYSAIHIASSTIPYKYSVNITLSNTITTLTTDRLILSLYIYKVSGSTAQTITTYFEQKYYSYLELRTLKPITSLPDNIISGTIANSNLYMTLPASGVADITSTENLSISCPSKILTIVGASPIAIGNDSTVPSTINLLSPGSSGSIYVNKRMNIIYTILPGSGQIGETITYKTLTTTPSFTSNSPLSINYSLNKGVWMVTANSGFLTVSSGNVSNMSIYINNISTLICRNDYSMQYPAYTNSVNVLTCSGLIDILTSTTITLFQVMTFSTGSYRVADADFNYNVQFVRVA